MTAILAPAPQKSRLLSVIPRRMILPSVLLAALILIPFAAR